jgi:hypothetical protein
MKGMLPPSPKYMAFLPKNVYIFLWANIQIRNTCELFVRDSSSHGSMTGTHHPGSQQILGKVTWAPYGGSVNKISFIFSTASVGFRVGGMRRDNLRVVSGLTMFPASIGGGSPAAPTIAS